MAGLTASKLLRRGSDGLWKSDSLSTQRIAKCNCSLRRIYLTGEVRKEKLYKNWGKGKDNCFRIQ